MTGATADADVFLTERRLAIGAFLDRMLIGDLVKACSRPGISEADVAADLRAL